MCGIVGIIPKVNIGFNKPHQKILYQMLLADVVRGSDATGVITCHNNGDFGIMKEASPSQYFVDQFEDSDLDKDLFKNGIAAIGHNRAKTIGENKDSNAHPFVVDDTFAMVHNGTLYNHKNLAKTDVDSEALAMVIKDAMDQDDWKEALEKALYKVYGAYAVVWFDQKRMQVGMVRNKDRPLGYLVSESGDILFGSELPMLSWIGLRNNLKLREYKSLDPGTLYLWTYNEKTKSMEASEHPLALSPSTQPMSLTGGTTDYTHKNKGAGKSANEFFRKSRQETKEPKKLLDQYGREFCSKNAAKRFLKKYLDSRITFTVTDVIDAEPPAVTGNYILLGEVTDSDIEFMNVSHLIKTKISLKETHMSLAEVELLSEWTGKISAVTYNRLSKSLEVVVTGAVPDYQQEVYNALTEIKH